MIILPRQARGKHRKNSKKSTVLLQLPADQGPARTTQEDCDVAGAQPE
jgi:hypothetical protein